MELINKNQVPEGYKKTEVGVIPEDWNIQTVSDIAIVKGGKRLPKGISLSDIPNPYPYIRVADMYEGGINTDDIKYVPEHIAPLIKNYRIYSTDLFISVAGTLGIIGEVPATMNGANLTENADRITGITCNKKFLFYALISERIKNEIDSQRTIGAQPKLALRRIEDFKLAFPNSDEEQKAIAQTLSDVDALIDELDKLIAKKRHIKTATMQQLLTGKTRLPGFGEGKGYKKTEVGVIPEDWEISHISNLTLSHKQGYYTKEKYVVNGTRLVRITDLYNPKIDYESMPMLLISDKDFEQYKIAVGDFLFARSGAIGRYGIVKDKINAIFGSYIIRFNFKTDRLLNDFFGYLFETQMIFNQLLSITQGSSNININAGNIKSLKIALPSITEQKAIAQVLSDMDSEIATLEKRRAKTQAIKQGMMQELLTGRTRLKIEHPDDPVALDGND